VTTECYFSLEITTNTLLLLLS